MKFLTSLCAMTAVAATFLLGAPAQAADFSLGGSISSNSDVVQIDFTLATTTSYVTTWTDSFLDGQNFDPNIAVWRWTGSDYALLASDDDNPDLGSGQTSSDAGLQFNSLAAGQYKLTIAAYGNFAVGSLLSEGFALSGSGVPIGGAPFGGSGDWHANLQNVDSASVSAVPEPASAGLMLAGMGLLGASWARRRRSARLSGNVLER